MPVDIKPSTAVMSRDRTFAWAGVAAVGVLAAGGAYWALKKAVDNYVPHQYHYRPGTFTGWLAKQLDDYSRRRRSRRPIRVYMDGCFDMMHYGHANALRQAKALGDVLVVGLIPDNEILRAKGPPVLNEKERYTLVDAVKWVDEIITDVPYELHPAFVEDLFTKHRIDYIIHGDDPCLLPDGTDAYAHAKKLGRFKMIKRTEGVSTTDIVGRMLTCTRVNHSMAHDQAHPLTRSFSAHRRSEQDSAESSSDVRVGVSRFMPTSHRLVQFSTGRSAPAGATIVYIDGAFDMFHPGHVDILRLARQQGDFLMVGLHTDEDVTARRGAHLPIMNVHERALSVLACKHVDEVIIGAPPAVSDYLLTTFNISLVVRGSVSETSSTAAERYAVPQKREIFRTLPSPCAVTTRDIIQRIVDNRAAFEARNAKKVVSEAAYYGNKGQTGYVQEI